VTQKTAPDPTALADFAELFVRLAAVAPNCCILQKKIEQALNVCNRTSPIFIGADIPDSSLALGMGLIGEYGAVIRISFGKYRDIVKQDRFWYACSAKALDNFTSWSLLL